MLILFLFVTLIFTGCEPVATFDTPQPENEKSLLSFSMPIQGKYMASDQASVITITDKLIIRHFDYEHKEHKDSLGTSHKIIGDSIIDIKNCSKEKIVLEGDTVIIHEKCIDTLFIISSENILKKFKGFFFLNKRINDKEWEVKKISLEKGVLSIGSISSKNDIQKLKEITETSSDTISTNFSLTKRQFKNFVKQNGFSEEEKFIRMNDKGR